MDGVPRLKQCCCGCSLRTGTTFVAWFGLIVGSLLMVYFVLSAMYASLLQESGRSGKTEEELESEITGSAIACFANLLRVIFALALMEGIYKGKLSLFVPWIIYTLVGLVIDCLCVYVIIVAEPERSCTYKLGLIIILSLHAYFILVVYSDYRESKENYHALQKYTSYNFACDENIAEQNNWNNFIHKL